MQTILIFYFSGTGNTKFIAENLLTNFRALNCTGKCIPIEEATNVAHLSASADIIGIGFPVHAFNAPRNVLEFVKKLPKRSNQKTFIFKSAGDTLANAGSTTELQRLLRKNGYQVFHESLYLMPSNVVTVYPLAIMQQMLFTAQQQSVIAAQEIINYQEVIFKPGWLLNLGSWLFSRCETIGARLLGGFHFYTKNCNHCQRCINVCPLHNIREKNHKIKFGFNCILCMRCVYGCPQAAIKIRCFNWFRLKTIYNIDKIQPMNNLSQIYRDKKTMRYFKHFKKYFSQYDSPQG